VALSRPKLGFESRWGRQIPVGIWLPICLPVCAGSRRRGTESRWGRQIPVLGAERLQSFHTLPLLGRDDRLRHGRMHLHHEAGEQRPSSRAACMPVLVRRAFSSLSNCAIAARMLPVRLPTGSSPRGSLTRRCQVPEAARERRCSRTRSGRNEYRVSQRRIEATGAPCCLRTPYRVPLTDSTVSARASAIL
jgi:hypothetical protein